MAKVEIDELGIKRYYNDAGDIHREDGPSMIFSDGEKRWIQHNWWKRDDGPSNIQGDGQVIWYVKNTFHRTNGPAWDRPNGHKEWHIEDEEVWPELK